MDQDLKRKLAAILVADVVGYSRLIADDEEATLRRLQVFSSIWQDCVSRCRGRIFNTAGDAILAEFQSVVDAVRCAVEFQAEARAQNDTLVSHRQMQFRIGITVGDVVERGSDLLGDGVNVAARLQTLAGPGGICVSSWVRESIANKLPVTFTDMGEQTVKNIPTPIRAYLIAAPGSTTLATALSEPGAMQDWLGRAVSSWKAMGAILGIAAAGVVGIFMATAQFRGPPTPPPPPRLEDLRPQPSGKTEPAKAEPAKSQPAKVEPPPRPESAKAEPIRPPQSQPEPASTETVIPGSVSPGSVAGPDPVTTAPRPASTPGPADPAVRLGQLTETLERELKPGDRFRECDTCPEMVVMPRGDFIMGAIGHERDETPTRKVTIGTRIAVARYAVMVDEFDTFVTVTGYRPQPGCRVFEAGGWRERAELSFRNPGFPQNGTHPAVCINWNDAKAYTDWMSARMRSQYRLPSEAEREFFTRAGTTTLFWWGNDITPARAAYDWSTAHGSGPKAATSRGTHPANAFQPNPWGLVQVHGNIAEWVEDCWGSYRNAPSDGTPVTSGDCSVRAWRGGSWGNAAIDLRSSYRGNLSVYARNFNVGFRVVRVLRDAR